MDKTCRACAKESKKLTPFWTNRGRRKPSFIVEDLNFLLLGRDLIKELPEDPLPTKICSDCIKKLTSAVTFIREFLVAQKKLKELCDSKTKEAQKVEISEKKRRLPERKAVNKVKLEIVEEVPPVEDETRISSDSDEDDRDENPPVDIIKVPSSPKLGVSDKIYQCTICSRVLGNKFRLRNHMRIHTGERPFVCTICKKAFAQPNALKCHVRLHTGEKPYKCPIESCGKSFRQNTTLKTHMAALHIGKSVKCESCDKTFTRASYLTAHQRLEHIGERPYACHLCPKRYKQKSHLDHHLEVHQGVKYVCNVCNRSYSKKWSLTVHSYTHMQDPDKKLPQACNECDESFARKDKLRSHIRAKHENIKTENHVEVVPIASNVVEVESRPIILEMEPVMDGLKQFDKRQYHVINIPEGTELIQEIVIPNEAIFY